MIQRFLWLTSFLVGGAVMVVELVGARMLAPTFGSSVVPWTATIASVLLGVAAGQAWGGRHSVQGGARTLRWLLLAAAGSVTLPLLRMDLTDRFLHDFGMVPGSLGVALLLFFPASFLFGAVGPLVVRLATKDLHEVGRRSGSLNGANALGAILGTLMTGFVFVPLLPLSWILGLTAAVLVLVSAAVACLEGSLSIPAGVKPVPARTADPGRAAMGRRGGES